MNDKRLAITNLALLQLAVAAPLVLAGTAPAVAGTIGWVACGVQLGLSPARVRDLRVMLSIGFAGAAVEWSAASFGAIAFRSELIVVGLPLWVFPSWAMLGVSLHYVLRRLRGRVVVGGLVGLAASALSLRAAAAVGEIEVAGRAAYLATASALALVVAVAAWATGRAVADD